MPETKSARRWSSEARLSFSSPQVRAGAARELADFPLPVHRLDPPYTAIRIARLGRLSSAALPGGTIFLVDCAFPGQDFELLETWIPVLRSHFPSVPVVLRITAMDAEMAHLSPWVAALRIRTVLVEREVVASVLRSTLCDPPDLADDVIEWLNLRRISLTPRTARLVHDFFARGATLTTVRNALRKRKLKERTVREWFSEASLPAPHAWLALAFATRAALRLQRSPAAPIFQVALQIGYSDYSALSRQMSRLFGVRPAEVRQKLGWEWLLDRWLNREGFP